MNPALPEGSILGAYTLMKVLGSGSFGITYLGKHNTLNSYVAIKEYFPREIAHRDSTFNISSNNLGDTAESFSWGLAKFLEEAKILAQLVHPNVVKVRDYFERNGTAYLVMDYYEGQSLDEILRHCKEVTLEEGLRLFSQLLDALEYIHSKNVLHRDIKPSNIYITSQGIPVLIDFGAARTDLFGLSRSVTSLATAGYSPFEQYSTRGNQGPWSDFYSLGATIHRLITGRKPPDSADRMLEDNHSPLCSTLMTTNSRDKSFIRIIDQCLLLRPEMRPQNARSIKESLNHSIVADSPKPLSFNRHLEYHEPLWKRLSKHLIALAILTSAGIVVLVSYRDGYPGKQSAHQKQAIEATSNVKAGAIPTDANETTKGKSVSNISLNNSAVQDQSKKDGTQKPKPTEIKQGPPTEVRKASISIDDLQRERVMRQAAEEALKNSNDTARQNEAALRDERYRKAELERESALRSSELESERRRVFELESQLSDQQRRAANQAPRNRPERGEVVCSATPDPVVPVGLKITAGRIRATAMVRQGVGVINVKVTESNLPKEFEDLVVQTMFRYRCTVSNGIEGETWREFIFKP